MIRDVLVHLDGGPADEERLAHAEAVATAFEAHLTGLYANPFTTFAGVMPLDGGAAAAQAMADLEAEVRRTGDAIEARLRTRLDRVGVRSELRRLDGTPWQLARWLAAEARRTDLFVASRPSGEGLADTAEMFEAVLFGGGRAVYVVPPGRRPPDAFRRVLVAWRDTRESARAVAEALPFVARATRTAIVLVDPDERDALEAPGAGLARHLGRYGTAVELFLLESRGRPVADLVLEEAGRFSADLVVMGGYGHSRAREWVLGGATREMLELATVPVLMAH